jgi:hypothetical protein
VSRRDLDDVWSYLMAHPALLWYIAFIVTVTLVLTVLGV